MSESSPCVSPNASDLNIVPVRAKENQAAIEYLFSLGSCRQGALRELRLRSRRYSHIVRASDTSRRAGGGGASCLRQKSATMLKISVQNGQKSAGNKIRRWFREDFACQNPPHARIIRKTAANGKSRYELLTHPLLATRHSCCHRIERPHLLLSLQDEAFAPPATRRESRPVGRGHCCSREEGFHLDFCLWYGASQARNIALGASCWPNHRNLVQSSRRGLF